MSPLCVKLLGWAAESLELPAEKSNVEFIDSWCQHNRGNECSLSTRIGVCVLCSHHHACIAHRYTAYNFRYLALIPSVVLELPNFKKILRTDKNFFVFSPILNKLGQIVLQSDQVWSRLDWKQIFFLLQGQKVVRIPFWKNAASK